MEEVKKAKQTRTKLEVTIDPGSSLLKVLYLINNQTVQWMIMGAEYMALPKSFASTLPKKNELGNSEDNAWFQVVDSEDCHLVGNLAKQKNISLNIKKSKNELLEKRVIAIIGAIANKHNLTKAFDLDLGVLIPINEIKEIASIKGWLEDFKERISNFTFQNQRVRAKLKKFAIKPEGFGIFASSRKPIGDKNTALIMMGHRNTSCLFMEKGNIQIRNCGTSMLGFFQVIKKLESEISYLSEESILAGINSSYENFKGQQLPEWGLKCHESDTKINFEGLIPPSFTRDKKEELERIKLIYNQALSEYWVALVNWLEQILPSANQIEYFIFSGGTSYLLKNKFSDLLKSYSASFYDDSSKHDSINHSIHKYLLYRTSPKIERFNRENLAVRFRDVWGFFVFFTEYDLTKVRNSETGKVEIKANA